MGKRLWSLILSAALVAGVFSVVPAHAQEAAPTQIPAEVNIHDPFGDANTQSGDVVGPADASTVGDLGKVWFSNTADTISLHLQVEGNPPASASNFRYNVYANPMEGKTGTASCLRFEIIPVNPANPGAYQGETLVKVLDRCPEAPPGTFYKPENGTKGELKIEILADKTGLMTATFPRSASPAFAPGKTITQPFAIDYIGGGTDKVGLPGTPATNEGPPGFSGLRLDDTKVGTDYVLTSGGGGASPTPDPKPTDAPPGKNDPPGKGKKKGCGKGKGKQKGACPKPKPPAAPSCPAYVPGEEGAEAETTIVTEAATEEKPIEIDFKAPAGEGNDLGLGAYDGTASLYQNIQVNSAAPDAGLYVRYEFADRHDYDLYLNRPDGSTAANSGDFNVAPGEGLGGGSPDGAWEGGSNYEQVMGIRTPDCGGYTARLVSFLTTGGATKLKIWLGPVVADAEPAAAEQQQSAADMFFGAMKMDNPMVASAEASSTPAATKGCTKGKGKKKGCKKPPVSSCAAYTPGELGAEQPVVTVTDANTADSPVIVPITLDPAADEGLLEAAGAGETPRAYFNVQVDSASASTGLYATFEFQSHRDYDFWAYNPDGSAAASSHGFQPLIDTKGAPGNADQSNTASNHAGDSTATSENIVGLITPDCGGYTFEASNYLGEGGDFEIKVWLGEGTTAPGVPE